MLVTKSLPLFILAAATSAFARLQKFNFDITKGNVSPDGFTRTGFLINGRSPGPEIEVDQNDDVEVFVRNNSPNEITIHFHGIEQKGTLFSDGVPGVTQEMIFPGGTFRYKWKANKAGAYWYHAHSKAFYSDGLRGTIYVRSLLLDPGLYRSISRNILDMVALEVAHRTPKFIAVNEWSHFDSETERRLLNETKIESLCVSSVLINGKGQEICPPPETFTPYVSPLVGEYTAKGCGLKTNPVLQPFPGSRPDLVPAEMFDVCNPSNTPLASIKVDPFFRYAAIAIVNIGGMWDMKVSIDNHKMWVYAADGQLVTPQLVDAVFVPLGDRFQAFVKLDQPAGDYAIRVAANVLPQKISGFGVLSYKRRGPGRGFLKRWLDLIPRQVPDSADVSPASFNSAPPPTAGTKMGFGSEMINGGVELNAAALAPYPASIKPPARSDRTIVLNMGRLSHSDFALNKDPFGQFLELSEPLLFNPGRANTLDPDLVPTYPVGSVVDLVFTAAPPQPPHSIHKHGSKAFVIGQGDGPWIWNTTAEAIAANPGNFNLNNPPLRDGFLSPPAIFGPSWMVVRYQSTEPGPVTLHCHINIHSVGGMTVVLMEGPENFPKVPPGLTN